MEAFRKACSFLLSRVESKPSDPAAELAYEFLFLLSRSEEDPRAADAKRHLESLTGDPTWGELAAFFKNALRAVHSEIDSVLKQDEELAERLDRLDASLLARGREEGADPPDLIEAFWGFFCPQAVGVRAKWEEGILELKNRRTVRDLSLSLDPLERPAEEVLFSANASSVCGKNSERDSEKPSEKSKGTGTTTPYRSEPRRDRTRSFTVSKGSQTRSSSRRGAATRVPRTGWTSPSRSA
jgi:hypothetical protein